MNEVEACTVCGATEFAGNNILWQELISDWELEQGEVDYINRQQGHYCVACGNNMRSLALAHAITRAFGYNGSLIDFIATPIAQGIRVLEINDAGGLSPHLAKLPLHRVVQYPAYDMMALDLPSQSFDLVLHSDSLEHIPDPILGLSECRRVLDADGRCIFTIPLIVGRMSRSREGMKKSYHGPESEPSDDYVVHTEFGADMWRYPIEAGFSSVRIHSLEYPAALAIEAGR